MNYEDQEQPLQQKKEEQDNNIFSEVFKIPESSTLNYDEKKDPKKNFFNLLNKKFGFVLTPNSDNAYKIFKERTMFVRKLNSKYSPNKKNNNFFSLTVIDNDDIEFVEEEKTTKKGKTKKNIIPQIKSNVENGYYKSFEFDFTNLKNPNYGETRKKIIYSLEYGTTENLKTNRILTTKLINDMDIIPPNFSFDNYGKIGDEIEDDDIENEKPISDAVLEDKKDEEETPIEPKEERENERMDPEEEIEDSPESPKSPKIKGKIPKKMRLLDSYSSYQNNSDNDSDDNSDDDYRDFEDSIYSNPSPSFGSSKNEFDDFFDSKGFMKLKGPDIFFYSTSKDGTQLISKFAFDKAKGQPNNSNNNNSQDSLLKLIVRASQDNKGEVKLEDIGEIQDLNGDITKLYSDMQKLKSEINLSNRKRDFARRDKLIIKYNKKKLKLSDLISKYSKEAYRLSTLNKKKKATIATHKYLMNKLDKLKT